MKLVLTSSQLEKLSDFSNDVAKGLMLAGILGQAVVDFDSVFLKVVTSVLVIILGLLFLYFSLLLEKK